MTSYGDQWQKKFRLIWSPEPEIFFVIYIVYIFFLYDMAVLVFKKCFKLYKIRPDNLKCLTLR